MRAQLEAAKASKAAGATKAAAAQEESKQAAATESSGANEFGLEKIEQKTDVAKIAVDDDFDIDDI